jgi:hypothetical protein
MDGKEKGHENSLALKELDDKQQNQMERPDDCKCSIREEGDKDKEEEMLNLQQRNIGVHGGQKAAAMKSSSKEDDDNEDSSSSESEGEVSIFGSLLCTQVGGRSITSPYKGGATTDNLLTQYPMFLVLCKITL